MKSAAEHADDTVSQRTFTDFGRKVEGSSNEGVVTYTFATPADYKRHECEARVIAGPLRFARFARFLPISESFQLSPLA